MRAVTSIKNVHPFSDGQDFYERQIEITYYNVIKRILFREEILIAEMKVLSIPFPMTHIVSKFLPSFFY